MSFTSVEIMQRAGLYVHIPFCTTRCGYCHFATTVESAHEQYVSALLTEVKSISSAPPVRDLIYDSIYFGGGTPSLLRLDLFERIVTALRASFRIDDDCEFTIEANPESPGGVGEHAAFYSGLGVNRVSIGVQSAVPSELVALDRRHTIEEVEETVALVRGQIENVNLDFILGVPGQDQKSLALSLELIRRLGTSHVSLYILEIFPETPISRLPPSDDDLVASLYQDSCRFLANSGYRHYEICNFAHPGRESRHNRKYWNGSSYIGLGLSAASFYDGIRLTNTSGFSSYLADPSRDREMIHMDRDSISRELLFLGLRTVEGIDCSYFENAFGYDPATRFRKDWEELMDLGLVVKEDTRFRIPEEKMLLGNEVFMRFL